MAVAIIMAITSAAGCPDVGRVRDGVPIINRTDVHIIVIDFRRGPRQVAQLPPHTTTRYSFVGCTGPLEFRTDNGTAVKRLEQACTGDRRVDVIPEDLSRSSP